MLQGPPACDGAPMLSACVAQSAIAAVAGRPWRACEAPPAVYTRTREATGVDYAPGAWRGCQARRACWRRETRTRNAGNAKRDGKAETPEKCCKRPIGADAKHAAWRRCELAIGRTRPASPPPSFNTRTREAPRGASPPPSSSRRASPWCGVTLDTPGIRADGVHMPGITACRDNPSLPHGRESRLAVMEARREREREQERERARVRE